MRTNHEPVFELSVLLNAAHRNLVPHWETPSWFKLFRKVDNDGSGLISYDEFVEMVRNDLKLSARALPEKNILQAWLALDTDGSGYLSSGEFGAFMRAAAPKIDRAPPHRNPPTSPRAFASPRRGHPGLLMRDKSYLTFSTRDSKSLRAMMDAQVEANLRASRTRNLLGSVGAPSNSQAPRPSPPSEPRPQSSRGRLEGTRDVQALQHQLAQAQALVRRLEQMLDAKGSRVTAAAESRAAPSQHNSELSAEADASESLAVLLLKATREDMARAIGALPQERRMLFHELTRREGESVADADMHRPLVQVEAAS
jgi:hypothetical protein